jgi:hypothetical protein
MTFPLGQTVTVNRVTQDAHGNKTVASTHTIDHCVFWPTAGKETIAPAMDVLEADMVILMPPGSDILSTDEVVVNGITYRVTGQPSSYTSPFTGFSSGIKVDLQNSEG